MYWADNLAERIMRANLDGSDIRTVVDEGLMDPGLLDTETTCLHY